MAQSNHTAPEENEQSRRFTAGDQVQITKEQGIPDCIGTITKKYVNSALVKLEAGGKITPKIMEEINGRYVVSYRHLQKVQSEPENA
ncbi:hypothetical protein [Loigolactobacillus rennini]|uniref:DUF2187 domain-containing protein n=2 Tax=Loigolactobacillus rennini TaxID=238013 RepID=A0A0R2DIV1_9LACO|nr:hypothetical protein [Loigolactobacillus rennini]KRM99875.1 hypothetical protein FC24_GL001707 [Loigolactobacillus rennini DSM 20253]SFZ87141.1 hypothetical protein LREN565_0254 [Loigolactobacillus rennini]